MGVRQQELMQNSVWVCNKTEAWFMPYSSGRRPFWVSPEVSTSGRLKLDFMTK